MRLLKETLCPPLILFLSTVSILLFAPHQHLLFAPGERDRDRGIVVFWPFLFLSFPYCDNFRFPSFTLYDRR